MRIPTPKVCAKRRVPYNGDMKADPPPRPDPGAAKRPEDLAEIPEFDRVMRALIRVPKSEKPVDKRKKKDVKKRDR
jgi:hypothetical protein